MEEFQIARVKYLVGTVADFAAAQRTHASYVCSPEAAQIPAAHTAPKNLNPIADTAAGLRAGDIGRSRQRLGVL